ncbi:hypothetical protein TNCV_543091 [Trichonephila clavipes]|nr:hypothetical protein TNCV_543091 [Trichonephila clavipes]
MQNSWLHEPDAISSASRRHQVVRIETHHSILLISSPLHSSLLSCPGKTYSPMVSIEQWYSRRSTAPETHTTKRVLHSSFIYYTTGTVIQLGGGFAWPWLEHRTPDRKAWVRCHQIPSEYTRSTCSLNQWVRSLVGRVASAGD